MARSRFPGTDAAADAAFVLGRMQFHSGAHRSSATWFETYLRERPDGRFAREAAGRLVEAYYRSGDEDHARDAAERYLRQYPDGPHAGLARSVVQ
ncbi:MAG: tetratricopeptide repeat protein [Deltaproteobacteria bacterium]|nr:tetratricopeptide repeat protein [Deltaproteobacteria bacterium]